MNDLCGDLMIGCWSCALHRDMMIGCQSCDLHLSSVMISLCDWLVVSAMSCDPQAAVVIGWLSCDPYRQQHGQRDLRCPSDPTGDLTARGFGTGEAVTAGGDEH